jgi:periplasmic mercuric ion binding protein
MMTKKSLLMSGLLATAFLLHTAHAEIAAPVAVQKQASSQSVILDLQNMTCAMCEFTIKKALQGVAGVEKAIVDYDTKTANVAFDPQKTSITTLIEATTDAGYPATVTPTKQ